MSDEYKQEARKILEERFGMSLEKLPVHSQPGAYSEMREIACKAKLEAVESRVRELEQERDRKEDLYRRQSNTILSMQEDLEEARGGVIRLQAQLQAVTQDRNDAQNWLLDGCGGRAYLDSQLAQLQARNRELEQALQGVMKLIDDGVLVREVKYDHEPGWTMRGFHLVMVLQQAQTALHVTDKAVKP
jgi:DNA repair exonuclease SbcCD ATPase subunit